MRDRKRAEAAGFLLSGWVDRCAVGRLQLYLEDSVCKTNRCYRLKMPLEERDQRAPRLQAGHRNSVPAIGSWPPKACWAGRGRNVGATDAGEERRRGERERGRGWPWPSRRRGRRLRLSLCRDTRHFSATSSNHSAESSCSARRPSARIALFLFF